MRGKLKIKRLKDHGFIPSLFFIFIFSPFCHVSRERKIFELKKREELKRRGEKRVRQKGNGVGFK